MLLALWPFGESFKELGKIGKIYEIIKVGCPNNPKLAKNLQFFNLGLKMKFEINVLYERVRSLLHIGIKLKFENWTSLASIGMS